MPNIMIIDTETIDLNKRFVYDVGFIVANKSEFKVERVLEESYIIKQVFDNKMLFHTAYYNVKLPKYTKMLKGKTSKRKHFGHTMQRVKKVLEDYAIDKVFAYNSPFDKSVFDYNIKYFKTESVFQYVQFVDIHVIANHFIHNTDDYINFCRENNFVTEKGYCKTNAEITYKFLLGNIKYQEEHTALEDCKIELDILEECIRKGYDLVHEYKKIFIKA